MGGNAFFGKNPPPPPPPLLRPPAFPYLVVVEGVLKLRDVLVEVDVYVGDIVEGCHERGGLVRAGIGASLHYE